MMTGKMIQNVLAYTLAITGIVRRCQCELLEAPFHEIGDDYLNEYLFFDESKYIAELQEFDDTTIEIDLLNRNRKQRLTHEEPRVLYQVGVRFVIDNILCIFNYTYS